MPAKRNVQLRYRLWLDLGVFDVVMAPVRGQVVFGP
jgi:hypothetical protein